MMTEAHPAPELLPPRLRRHAAERAGAPALSFLDANVEVVQAWDYAELDRRARSVAAFLQASGHASAPVVLAYPSCLEFVAAFLGCLYAGAVAVPACLPRSSGGDRRLAAIVEDCGARSVLTLARHAGAVGERVPATQLAVVATDTLPDSSAAWIAVHWEPEQLALLQYTSGSTRAQAGVMISHANLAANLQALGANWGTTSASVGVSWLPLFHDMGLVGGTLEPLWTGYPAALMAPATFVQSPLRWLRAMSQLGATVSGGPNFAYDVCVDAARLHGIDGLDLRGWQIAWNGSEPVRAATLRDFAATFAPAGLPPTALTPAYGLAEATLLVSAGHAGVTPCELAVDSQELCADRIKVVDDSALARRLVGSGRPAGGAVVQIVVPGADMPAAFGRVGEIWVQGPSVGGGYWHKPRESEDTFGARLAGAPGNWLRTGDLGFLHDGELFVTGRLKDVLVVRGVNHYPQDIEHTIFACHPALRHDAGAVVMVEEDEHGGQGISNLRIVAIQEVTRSAWRQLNADAVCTAIRRAVAREHQVALGEIVLLKPYGLPRTTSGKVQRRACRAALAEGALPVLHTWRAEPESGATTAPIVFTGEPLTQPGVLERQLVSWLEHECALSGLSWKTPLMDLGIDSLKGVELGNALSMALNHNFPATLLIDYPTVAALADLIRREVLGQPAQAAPDAPAAPAAPTAPSVAPPADLSATIDALGDDELDALLAESIGAVLHNRSA